MKKFVILIVAITLCLSVFAGCSTQTSKEVTETTTVLYVGQECFIATLGGHVCYVDYANAGELVTVGDLIELTYIEDGQYAVVTDQTLGGYQWDTVLLQSSISNLVVK